MEWEKIIEFSPAFDKRNPNPGKNYGIGAVQIVFVLKKGNKAVQFRFGTDWYLPETVKEYREKGVNGMSPPVVLREGKNCGVQGWDVGYHSPKPMFKDQTSMGKCEYIKANCYYDGSSLRAEEYQEILIRKGSKGVWEFLEKEWKQTFGKKKKGKSK